MWYPKPELTKCNCKSCNIKLCAAQIEWAAICTVNEHLVKLGAGDFDKWFKGYKLELVGKLEKAKNEIR